MLLQQLQFGYVTVAYLLHSPFPIGINSAFSVRVGQMPVLGCLHRLPSWGTCICVGLQAASPSSCLGAGRLTKRHSTKAGIHILPVTRFYLLSSLPSTKSSRNISRLEEVLWKPDLAYWPPYWMLYTVQTWNTLGTCHRRSVTLSWEGTHGYK